MSVREYATALGLYRDAFCVVVAVESLYNAFSSPSTRSTSSLASSVEGEVVSPYWPTATFAPTTNVAASSDEPVGDTHSFAASASDCDGRVLSDRSANRPIWAEFCFASSQSTGNPASTDVGTEAHILRATACTNAELRDPVYITLPNRSIAAQVGVMVASVPLPTDTNRTSITDLSHCANNDGAGATALSESLIARCASASVRASRNLLAEDWDFAPMGDSSRSRQAALISNAHSERLAHRFNDGSRSAAKKNEAPKVVRVDVAHLRQLASRVCSRFNARLSLSTRK